MIYKLTKANIYTLMRAIGYATEEQLIQFFRDAEDAYNVPYYIHNMVNQRNLAMDKRSGVVSDFRVIPMKSDAIHTRIYVFWLLAALGSEKIRDISTMEYPGEIVYVTDENEVFEITFINDLAIARLAMNKRHAREMKELPPDDTHQVALVLDEEIGQKMEAYGFDCYCLLDTEHKPHFHYFEEEK